MISPRTSPEKHPSTTATALRMFALLLLACVAPAAEEKPAPAPVFPAELTLTSKTVLKKTTPTKWTKDWVVIRHVGGVDPIRYENIAEPQRATILAMRDAAIATQRDAAAEANAKQQQEYETKLAIDRETKRQQELFEELARKNRIAIGMPENLVVRAIGTPDRKNTDSYGIEQWVYLDGTYVYMHGGRVRSWQKSEVITPPRRY